MGKESMLSMELAKTQCYEFHINVLRIKLLRPHLASKLFRT